MLLVLIRGKVLLMGTYNTFSWRSKKNILPGYSSYNVSGIMLFPILLCIFVIQKAFHFFIQGQQQSGGTGGGSGEKKDDKVIPSLLKTRISFHKKLGLYSAYNMSLCRSGLFVKAKTWL